MKFGGSSLASPSAIRRVIEIIQRQAEHQRIVVVSAHGNTTDRLVQIISHAARAETYLSWKAIKELREYHFSIAEELLSTQSLTRVDTFLREIFRDLHVRMLEVCDGERTLTTEDRAWVMSIGEQISSRLMTAALVDSGLTVQHTDSRKLILTDSEFCHATPHYWETYARFRWAIPAIPGPDVFVMGGFMGATRDGRTTVFSRGGSDLTATIAGAALNAEEIQIWKDVDGMLTCDPRLKTDGLVVKHLSYTEAAALAQAGAKILHPDTIAPAQRLRIPILLKNTFRPESEGSRIGAPVTAFERGVKSIVCRKGLLLLDICVRADDFAKPELSALAAELEKQGVGVQVLSCSSEQLLLVADSHIDFSSWNVMESGCLQASVKGSRVLMTLVGTNLSGCHERVLNAVGELALVVQGDSCIYVVAEEAEAKRCLDLLHVALFHAPDSRLFAARHISKPQQPERIKAARLKHATPVRLCRAIPASAKA
jgi:aspartate kinase